jgi:hypothetical protein
MVGIVALLWNPGPLSPIAIILDLVSMQALPSVQQPSSNLSKSPEN